MHLQEQKDIKGIYGWGLFLSRKKSNALRASPIFAVHQQFKFQNRLILAIITILCFFVFRFLRKVQVSMENFVILCYTRMKSFLELLSFVDVCVVLVCHKGYDARWYIRQYSAFETKNNSLGAYIIKNCFIFLSLKVPSRGIYHSCNRYILWWSNGVWVVFQTLPRTVLQNLYNQKLMEGICFC